MSLAHAILAVLADGPRHGYSVRLALGDLMGSFWPVNQGQVYTTLNRLARQRLVIETSSPVDAARVQRKRYVLSQRGRSVLETWLVIPGDHRQPFDDWVARLAICERFGETDLLAKTLRAQRTRCATLRHALGHSRDDGPAAQAATNLLAAELDWLDVAERELLRPRSTAGS